MSVIIGWDIGGAHLKAARSEAGRIVRAVQVPSPLRLGLPRLAAAFAEVKAAIGDAGRHVATMTGELADTFASRGEGVRELAALVARALAPADVAIYAGPAGFIRANVACDHVRDIASANWHASASLIAHAKREALFMDMGSTTTDVVPIVHNEVRARGYTDAERLEAGELVYTGLVRSFLMAVSDRAPFTGRWTTLINENFATMADIHRILGSLPADADQMSTADGREKTIEASRARLAHMVGCDAADATDEAWLGLARWFAEAQMRTIIDAAMLAASRGEVPPDSPVVGAGIGAAVLREVARRLGRDYVAFETLLDVDPLAREAASRCAPAAALALLAARQSRLGA